MKIKAKYSVVDIIGVVLIFIVLVIFVIPLIMKTTSKYKYDGSKVRIQALYTAALEEYKEDANFDRTIISYCYRDDYGYPKTLDGGSIKSISNLKDEVSYYITFDSEGNIISLVYADNKYGVNIDGIITDTTINLLDENNFITREEAFKIISKCPYNSK